MRITRSEIKITGISSRAYHGVLPHERKIGNEYRIDIVVGCEVSQAIEQDNLEYTINYAELYELVRQEMSLPSALLEHVVGRILKGIEDRFPFSTDATVTITKLTPPIKGFDADGASFTAQAVFTR